ncbi:uncharacterized protein SCHCODRAFT_02104757 [Schizophyllum commune H4-8]|uniref:uncharacterized protein n=1 Tax=Schizophyllum commune (strain H4-8 / FGSC 9210) TaxID=578458 RepID=UPI002160214C|nr:uncharacterized protein SCHCODRAFT_02104757 [Schizophyllum commune H4-8]KAI5886694.1 hypothetical protein SCHCODRAFT_02104757 [Schizophyllum commune H4-8]
MLPKRGEDVHKCDARVCTNSPSSSLLRGLRGTSSATAGRCCIAGGMRSATTVWRAAGTLVMSDDMDDESVGLEWTRAKRELKGAEMVSDRPQSGFSRKRRDEIHEIEQKLPSGSGKRNGGSRRAAFLPDLGNEQQSTCGCNDVDHGRCYGRCLDE